jgi:hypothetical protein
LHGDGVEVGVSVIPDLAFVLLAGIGAAVSLAALAHRLPADRHVFESALRDPVPSERRPAQLVRVEHLVASSRLSGWDAHHRLRPVLIDIAELRLARHGLRLEHDLAETRRWLGPTTWDFLRPDRPAPEDRQASGIAADVLEDILEALETL